MEIKMHEKECPMCKKKFSYWDMSHVPVTCGSRMCERNYQYQQAHKDQYGNVPTPEEIKKWN
jgi:hypothetical protein